ncbi:DUF397 domain-containing protein [Streptomyces sp. NBC_00481]|uniref:DUF397 domain-containing protein n=1 Tax=Streptomyces sp. NBC_00481 TaxID=2975755 RepID=UPI002DDAAF02|nr:DUF397 domain-containing protein [Streptomyces sp. NBC_00481]WRY96833.1 DUF397 domain-containing protein [Streptomyces sp. NBC_00481]
MAELNWQKSSFSAGPEGECLYIATAPYGTLRLRESDEPQVILAADPRGLAALLRRVKADQDRASAGR